MPSIHSLGLLADYAHRNLFKICAAHRVSKLAFAWVTLASPTQIAGKQTVVTLSANGGSRQKIGNNILDYAKLVARASVYSPRGHSSKVRH